MGGPIIVIDTNEQLPYTFQEQVARGEVGIVQASLYTGDYSLVGFENRVSVERKSLGDAFGTIGGGRDRFDDEMDRAAAFEYFAIVIETSLSGLEVPPRFSRASDKGNRRLSPETVIKSLIGWSMDRGVHVWLADNRSRGELTTFRILERFHNVYKDRPCNPRAFAPPGSTARASAS